MVHDLQERAKLLQMLTRKTNLRTIPESRVIGTKTGRLIRIGTDHHQIDLKETDHQWIGLKETDHRPINHRLISHQLNLNCFILAKVNSIKTYLRLDG